MKQAEKEGLRLYEISADNGYTWSQQWLTRQEACNLLDNFYRVRETKRGFEWIEDKTLEDF